ncbi:hypothetical protein TEA_023227 [Camellia sinensis var. sinensis]|uniref:HMG box domain-containing protein n=1 Tax=Camellia sinensis var. sinensis TaxID=542762 RepID=A0A4S4DMF5_CAMSN|nr:hypothetical protein TEA_023227 [Camellia sinensis var. sinensis]
MASSSDSMDNTFRARVQKIFGSLSSSSSSLSPPWSLTDGEVEKREWRQPSSAKDDDQTPISFSFNGLACRVVGFRHERRSEIYYACDSECVFLVLKIDFFVVRLSVKRGAPSEKAGKKPAVKKGKAAKDPNKPKRPASAFFVGKAGGDKWKSLSDAEKAPYVAKVEKRKTEYNKTLEAYNKKMAEGPADEEESDKLRSEVNDEDDEDDENWEVYALSWLVIVAAMIILKIVSMGRKKFSADFQLMFRLLKLFLFIGSVVTVVTLFAFLSEAISGGKLVIDVAYFGFHIYSEIDELCGKTSCPISAGDFLISHSQDLPGFIPPGTYILTMKMEDGNKNQLTCINFDFSIGFFVSDAVEL